MSLYHCPVCRRASVIAHELDRYVHINGDENRSCWDRIRSGAVQLPARPIRFIRRDAVSWS